MADVVSLILTAKNDASKAINQVNKDITSLEKKVGQIGNLQKVQTAITSGFAIGAFSQTIGQIVQGTAELSQAGANIERLRTSFESLAQQNGTSGAKILNSIDSITQGTLSQQAMMEQANAAMLLGVATTGEEFETLAKIAIDRGRAMGISMEYAFESIVKGVGRLSPLILDNLGIVLDADTTYAQYAKTIGKTADSLSDMEKRKALIGRLKEETAGFDNSKVIDAAGSWEKFTASMTNAAAAAGTWINAHTPLLALLKELTNTMDVYAGYWGDDKSTKVKSYATSIADLEAKIASLQAVQDKQVKVTDAGSFFESIIVGLDKNRGAVEEIEHLTKWVAQLKMEMNSLLAAEGASANRMAASGSDVGEITAKGFSVAQNAAAQLESRVADMAKEMGMTKDAAMNLAMGVVEFKGSIYGALPALDAMIAKAIQAKAELQAMNSAISGALGGFQSAVVQAYVDSGYNQEVLAKGVAMGQTLKAGTAALQEQGYEWIVTEAKAREMQDAASSGFIAISDAAKEAGKATGGVKDKTVQLTQEFQNLKSVVQNVVNSALGDIGGADLEKYLPHQDTASEPARRIASVMVEGFNSEWSGYFKDTFPSLFSEYMGKSGGDVQKAAALLLSDFQNGLRPELLDKGKIKELAKSLFLADQETSKMVDEIARELAGELNISIEEAQAAVGGAVGGNTKKKLTEEELKKLMGDIENLAPKPDFSTFSQDLMAAGKSAGVLDSEGRIIIPVGLNLNDSISLDTLKKLTNLVIPISGVEFADLEAAKKSVSDDLSGLYVSVLPTVSVTFDSKIFNAELNAAIGVVYAYVKPSTAVEDWTKLFADVKTYIGDVSITIAPSAPNAERSKGASYKMLSDFYEGMVDWNVKDNFGNVIYYGIKNSIEEKQTSYGILGLQIGFGIYQGLHEYQLGTIIATELSNQLNQAQKTFEASAQNAGKTWGNAFIDTVRWNVPFELLLVLTDLITPEVVKRVNEEKNRSQG